MDSETILRTYDVVSLNNDALVSKNVICEEKYLQF